MNATARGRVSGALLVIISLVAAQVACGLFTNQSAAPAGPSAPGQPGQGSEAGGPGEAPGPGEGSGAADEGEGVVEPEFESDHLPCPPKGTLLYLGFDHVLTINYGETSITHILNEGKATLRIVDDNGTIQPVNFQTIDYSMEGVMSKECTLTSQGTMMPSAHGSCEAGVVSLIIEENWMPLEGEMVCIDEDEVDIVPFNTPPLGVQTHSGPDGNGEVFFLVAGADGYSTMRPFLEGDGYHTWTLYMPDPDDIPPVPLAP